MNHKSNSTKFTATIRFRFDSEANETYLLCRLPGDDYFIKVATRKGLATEEECTKLVQQIVDTMQTLGHDVDCKATIIK